MTDLPESMRLLKKWQDRAIKAEGERDRAVDALRRIADASWPDNEPDATMGQLLGHVHRIARGALDEEEHSGRTD